MFTSDVKFKSDHIPSPSHGTCDVVLSYRESTSLCAGSGRVDDRGRREAEVQSWTLKVVSGRLTTRRKGPVHGPLCLG